MRGEYTDFKLMIRTNRELPPRARRILPAFANSVPDDGTTSACAENTEGHQAPTLAAGNYLRVRGEYHHCFAIIVAFMELPPRARRIL